jgi:hypothetical protein
VTYNTIRIHIEKLQNLLLVLMIISMPIAAAGQAKFTISGYAKDAKTAKH